MTYKLFLMGTIGGDSISGKYFAQSILDAAAKPDCDLIELYIASGGGSVDDAGMILTAIHNCGKEVHTINAFNASSCAAVIALAGRKRYAAPYASYMLHRAYYVNQQGVPTNYVDDNLSMINGTLIGTIATCTGLSDAEVEAKYLNGEDVQLTAQQALADGIINGIKKINRDTEAVFAAYRFQVMAKAQEAGIYNGMNEENKDVTAAEADAALAAGLAENTLEAAADPNITDNTDAADDADMNDAADDTNTEDQTKTLKVTIDASMLEGYSTMIAAALDEMKDQLITKDEFKAALADYTAELRQMVQQIQSKPVPVAAAPASIKNVLNLNSQVVALEDQKFIGKKHREIEKMKGGDLYLMKVKQNNPDQYQMLWEASYGKK